MKSPFYKAEQERLYPNRINTVTGEEVAKHAMYLISKGIVTKESLSNTRIGTLQNNYFLNASVNDILIGLKLVK